MIGWPNDGASESRTDRGTIGAQHLVAEVVAHLADDLIGELGAGVVHHAHDRADLERRVEVAPDEVDVAQQLPETLERVVLALDRDEHLAGRAEAVDGQQAERRGAVDEDVVVVVEHGLDRPPQPGLPAERRDELDLGAGEVEAGRGDEQALDVGRLDAVLERHLVHQHVVHRRLEAAVLDAEPGRGVALRVEVDDQRALAELGQAGADVDRRRGLADAALLVGDGDDAGERDARRRRSAATSTSGGRRSAGAGWPREGSSRDGLFGRARADRSGPPGTAWRGDRGRVKRPSAVAAMFHVEHRAPVDRVTVDVSRETSTRRTARRHAWSASLDRAATPTVVQQRRPASGRPRSRRLADDDQAARTRAAERPRRERLGRRSEASGHDGVDRRRSSVAAASARRPSSTSTRSLEPERRDEPAQVIGPRGPAVDEHEPQVGAGAGRSPDRAHRRRCRDRRPCPATSARASTNAPACSMTSSIGRSPSMPEALRRRRARRRSAASSASTPDRSGRGDDHAAVRVLALGPAGRRRRSRPARRGGPCGRPTASGRASGRRPLARTCSATVAANCSSATRRFSR